MPTESELIERPNVTDVDDQAPLLAAADRIRASSALGRSQTLRRLFDYLIACSVRGDIPKELEIAAEVFGKYGSDMSVDASTRVYVHRLRKKLDDYYAGPGLEDGERLQLPKGEYRFEIAPVVPVAAPPPVEEQPVVKTPSSAPARGRWLMAGIGVVAGIALSVAALHLPTTPSPLDQVRASPVWTALLDSPQPLTIVSGDYFIIGERDRPNEEPARLVRDFSINSREELDEMLMFSPALRERYVDLNLFYLPVSAAHALKTIMPIVDAKAAAGNVAQLPSSKLTPAHLKNSDLVYVGFLSGLGLLRQAVFTNSRFGIGGSFDEIIDTKTGTAYVATAPRDTSSVVRNYAYIAMLPGPQGNRILIIAGTRDPALLQAADLVNSPEALEALSKASPTGYFEALYAVDGVSDENLKGSLIAVSPRSGDKLWDAMD